MYEPVQNSQGFLRTTSHFLLCCLKKNLNAPRPSAVVNDLHVQRIVLATEETTVTQVSHRPVVVVVVFFTLTDRASTIPSNIRGC